MKLFVDGQAGLLYTNKRSIACSIGRGALVEAAAKTEGDGATPRGRWPIRGILLRPDRAVLPPGMALPWRWLRPDDGWSDDGADSAYNRPVRHPHWFSAERLWRDDGLYDVIVVLGHNDAPPVAWQGSAIFLHCRRDTAATEGCVAIAKADLLELVPALAPGDTLEIG